MKIIKFETRFILFLFMFSFALKVTLSLNTNIKTSITNSLNNQLNLNLLNLLELNKNSNSTAELKNKSESSNKIETGVHSESKNLNSSLNQEKIQDDNSYSDSQINGNNQESIASDGSENLITDLEPEERAQSESTASVTSEAKTKDPLRNRDPDRFKLTTKKTSTDKGNILTLAKFDVRCPPGEVLSGYHMWGESNYFSSNQIGVEYNCVKIPQFNRLLNKPFNKVSKAFEVKGDIRDALLIISKKDLNIECPDGKILSHFAYTVVNNLSIGLQTTCVDAKIKDCKSVFTKEENIRTFKNFGRCINQYSQFFIEAEPGKVLQKVRHFKVNEDIMKVYVTSCTLDYPNEDKKEEEKKKKEEEMKKKKEEEEKNKIDLQNKLKEEEKRRLEAKKIDDERKAKELKEQKDKLRQKVAKVNIENNNKEKLIENSKAVINKMISKIANNEIKKQQEVNIAKNLETKRALLQDDQKKILADKEKALKNMNAAREEKKIKKKEEDRLLDKLLTLKEKLKKEVFEMKTLKDEKKTLKSNKIEKEKLIANSKSEAEKNKLRDEIKKIDDRIAEIEKNLNPKRQTKLQTELDIKNLERSLNNNKSLSHEIINKEIEAEQENKNKDEQVKIIQDQIKENVKIEDKVRKETQNIDIIDKKLEQQLAEEKNKEKKLTDEEIKSKIESEKIKNEAEKKQEEEIKVKEKIEQTKEKLTNDIGLLPLNPSNTLNVSEVTPLDQNKIIQNPSVNINTSNMKQINPLNNSFEGMKNILNKDSNTKPQNDQIDSKAPLPSEIVDQIQQNRDTNQGTAIGSNLDAEKIDKNLVNKNSFCSQNCYDDNQNTVHAKKCYINGVVKNCFTCKSKEVSKTEKEKNIEKICINFCNHVENTPSCLYFGYINKDKKQIDVDPKILIELGIKKSNKKLRIQK